MSGEAVEGSGLVRSLRFRCSSSQFEKLFMSACSSLSEPFPDWRRDGDSQVSILKALVILTFDPETSNQIAIYVVLGRHY